MDPIQMMALVISVRLHTLLSCISETNAYHCISLQGKCNEETYSILRAYNYKYNLQMLTSIFVQCSNDFGVIFLSCVTFTIKNVFIDKKNMESKVQSKSSTK
ncbi:hypothetical protein T12_8383 [Trichinella patagoniensis]|uniref:Uncharacterized protein n=1 Tax=Trichinella patagoniensis TaxID=990121 RepID=A0A0V1A1S4_9BILA|nr:hypothetical protein T12_8383 [Trichinella patagoniensis]